MEEVFACSAVMAATTITEKEISIIIRLSLIHISEPTRPY